MVDLPAARGFHSRAGRDALQPLESPAGWRESLRLWNGDAAGAGAGFAAPRLPWFKQTFPHLLRPLADDSDAQFVAGVRGLVGDNGHGPRGTALENQFAAARTDEPGI